MLGSGRRCETLGLRIASMGRGLGRARGGSKAMGAGEDPAAGRGHGGHGRGRSGWGDKANLSGRTKGKVSE